MGIDVKTILFFRTTRLSNFPQYLLIHLKKYNLREDWTPVKLDVSVEVPDILDLSALKGHGLQTNEELLPNEGKNYQKNNIKRKSDSTKRLSLNYR